MNGKMRQDPQSIETLKHLIVNIVQGLPDTPSAMQYLKKLENELTRLPADGKISLRDTNEIPAGPLLGVVQLNWTGYISTVYTRLTTQIVQFLSSDDCAQVTQNEVQCNMLQQT